MKFIEASHLLQCNEDLVSIEEVETQDQLLREACFLGKPKCKHIRIIDYDFTSMIRMKKSNQPERNKDKEWSHITSFNVVFPKLPTLVIPYAKDEL